MSQTVSALITNYNTWSLTALCIQELNRWSKGELTEILVVDDTSSESIPTGLPSNVRVVQNPQNCGYVASVNIGFSQLREDIILLLDSDAYPLTDLVTPLGQEFSANSRLGALGFHLVGSQGQPTGFGLAEPSVLGLLLGQQLEALWDSRFNSGKSRSLCLFSCALAVRRTAFEEIGGFDESFDFLDADLDFSMRLHAAGWHVQVEPSLTAFHEGKGSFQTTSTRVLRHHKNRWHLLDKHNLLHQKRILKAGLMVRHTLEYLFLRVAGKRLIAEPEILADKLHSRQQLLHQVWSGYGNECK